MRKTVVILLAIALLLALPALWLNLQEGLYVGDDFLRRTGEGRYGDISLERLNGATHVTGRLRNSDFTAQLVWSSSVPPSDYVGWGDRSATVTFPDGETISGVWMSPHLCSADGMPNVFGGDMIRIVTGNEEPPLARTTIADLICRMDLGDTERYGSPWLVLAGLVIYAIGALSVLFPDRMHFLGGRWAYANPELSDEGRFFQRLGGAVAMIDAAIIMYLPLLAPRFS